MRELKFRAWCHEDKVMIYDLNSPRLVHGELKDDLYEFMQYTGLTDKTGNEIYEGDIVQYPTGFKEQVEFNNYGFWNIYDNVGNSEIIGNIHEHKHLLENKL